MPFATDVLGGVIVIDVNVATVTVTAAVPDTPAWVAVIVAEPTPVPVTSPWLPCASLTTALVESEDVQLADCVRSWVDLSEKVPVAVSCWLVPLAIDTDGGVTTIEESVGDVTVAVMDPETVPTNALTSELPTPRANNNPCRPVALLTTAILGSTVRQATTWVRSCVELSE